jgi:hypothetical protein
MALVPVFAGWAAVATAAGAAPASAAPSSSAAVASSSADPTADLKLDQAKQLFRQGNELRRAGDCQRALELFLQSRTLVPSVPNTLNSAVCLEQIGRFDEALEMFEQLLTRFGEQVDDSTKREVAPVMASLRRKVGSLDVSSNVEGVLVIDGRMRGRLPLVSAVRLLPGRHVVRVVKDGYETYEGAVELQAGQSAQADARLKPLASAGRLRVDDADMQDAELFVDGAVVGRLPWEGTLAPGDHLYWVRKGDRGTAPRRVVVVQGQTVLAPAVGAALGPDFRLVSEPATAQIWIDGVAVGRGLWQGRLPKGEHTLDARETGYFPAARKLGVTAETRGDVRLALRADPSHPRWGVAKPSGHFRVDVFGGPGLAPTLGSGAEAACDAGTCTQRSTPFGWMAGARAAYDLAMGLGFEVGVGYMSLGTTLARRVDESFSVAATATTPAGTVASQYDMKDSLWVRGPVAVGGVSYRHALGERWEADARIGLGAWIASASDAASGTATAGGVTRPVAVESSGAVTRAAAVFAMPGLGFYARVEGFRLGVAVAAALMLTDGPASKAGNVRVRDAVCDSNANPGSIDCAPDEGFTRGEKAFGRLVAVMPMVSGGREF